MLRPLLTGLAAAVLSMGAQANIVVQSYTMLDGADLHGAYFDNGYTASPAGTLTGSRSLVGGAGLLSGGKGDLTDGVLSASVSAGYGAWAPYVMWDGSSPVITFDLGSSHILSSVTTYFKYYPAAAVYMPGSVGMRFSDDGVNFGGTQTRSLSAAERVPGANDSDGVFQVLTSPASGRYVELTLNNGPEGRWLALGEVVFDGAPGSLAASVPEPGAASLVLVALAGMGVARRRKAHGRAA
ncbi:conserved exported hypothetical protein [Rubrivivax sp. A210]|uniref:discoidin domain-containing protein n=1 Tax=Rubrivivax sp. A210 TaxID=2772301 RepID=UPI00191A4392|nr:discoidin domain-containing protein [Rubrivivax sp. A210]CAD5372653.1 conserved exported hypothetical protein [Rubrivivax sp. A210]